MQSFFLNSVLLDCFSIKRGWYAAIADPCDLFITPLASKERRLLRIVTEETLRRSLRAVTDNSPLPISNSTICSSL